MMHPNINALDEPFPFVSGIEPPLLSWPTACVMTSSPPNLEIAAEMMYAHDGTL
jgi:hypothetical protein